MYGHNQLHDIHITYDLQNTGKGKGKGKGKGTTSHEDPKRYSSTLSLTSALDRVDG
jgi:hypothetical protein